MLIIIRKQQSKYIIKKDEAKKSDESSLGLEAGMLDSEHCAWVYLTGGL